MRVGGNLDSHVKLGSTAVRTTSRSALQWNQYNLNVGKDLAQNSNAAFWIKRVRRGIKTLDMYGDRGQAEAGGLRRSPPYPCRVGDGQRKPGAGRLGDRQRNRRLLRAYDDRSGPWKWRW